MLPFYEDHHFSIRVSPLRGGFSFRGHLHVQCELIWVRRGSMHMICNNQEYLVSGGELCVIFPNQVHAYLGSSEDVEGYLLMFHPEDAYILSKQLLRSYPKRPWLSREEVIPELAYVLDWLEREYREGGEAVVRSLLSPIMLKICEVVEPISNTDGREADVIRQAMQYIDENYAENITLEGLAHKLGISHYHLSHLFSAYLKMGFRAYINALRVEQAKRLLMTTDESITQIAYNCGFASQTTFNRAFRERFSKTPREIRQGK